jgi:hypothetical protein
LCCHITLFNSIIWTIVAIAYPGCCTPGPEIIPGCIFIIVFADVIFTIPAAGDEAAGSILLAEADKPVLVPKS